MEILTLCDLLSRVHNQKRGSYMCDCMNNKNTAKTILYKKCSLLCDNWCRCVTGHQNIQFSDYWYNSKKHLFLIWKKTRAIEWKMRKNLKVTENLKENHGQEWASLVIFSLLRSLTLRTVIWHLNNKHFLLYMKLHFLEQIDNEAWNSWIQFAFALDQKTQIEVAIIEK